MGIEIDQGSPRRQRRDSVASRKDPEQEFFTMTLLSHIMKHPKKNNLIAMQGDTEILFRRVKSLCLPFFEWNDWIAKHIDQTLAAYREKRDSRLSKLGRDQKKKLLKKAQ